MSNDQPKTITRLNVLREMQDMAWHNVFCYSADWAMTRPKAGLEEEWSEATAKAEIVDLMVAEEKEKEENQ